MSEKIVTEDQQRKPESGLLLTDVQVGHCITPQATMYLDSLMNYYPFLKLKSYCGLNDFGFLKSESLKVCLAPVCGMKMSKTPLSLGEILAQSDVSSAW